MWRDNDAILQPTLVESPLTAELVPVSHSVSRTATLGLRALDTLHGSLPMRADMKQKQLAELKELRKPNPTLVNAIVPGVEALVYATSEPAKN